MKQFRFRIPIFENSSRPKTDDRIVSSDERLLKDLCEFAEYPMSPDFIKVTMPFDISRRVGGFAVANPQIAGFLFMTCMHLAAWFGCDQDGAAMRPIVWSHYARILSNCLVRRFKRHRVRSYVEDLLDAEDNAPVLVFVDEFTSGLNHTSVTAADFGFVDFQAASVDLKKFPDQQAQVSLTFAHGGELRLAPFQFLANTFSWDGFPTWGAALRDLYDGEITLKFFSLLEKWGISSVVSMDAPTGIVLTVSLPEPNELVENMATPDL